MLDYRIVEILPWENIGYGLFRVILVVRIAGGERVQRAEQVVPQRQRILLALVVVGDDLLDEAVVREILHVHRHRLAASRLQSRVETKIGNNEVHSSAAGEVAGDDAIPPAVALVEAGDV